MKGCLYSAVVWFWDFSFGGGGETFFIVLPLVGWTLVIVDGEAFESQLVGDLMLIQMNNYEQ